MIRNAILTALAVTVLMAASSAYTWIEAPANSGQVRQAGSEVAVILHAGAAVVLVVLATVMTWAAVRAVSSRRVVRIHHRDDDEPPLPYHKPEPEPEPGEDARTPLPAGRQASALSLPGRAPATPPKRTLAPEPGFREVPR